MMKRLSTIEAPALAGVVREKTARAAIAEIKNCYLHGAAMIDLHLSCLEDQSEEGIRAIIEKSPLPVLALNYASAYDWSAIPYTEEEREELFLRAIRAGAAGVDIQGYTFDLPSKTAFVGENKYSFTKDNPKEVVTDPAVIAKQCAFIEKVHALGGEVLLSCHPGIAMNREQIVELALFLEKRNPDIIKIVSIANTEEDMLESLHAMRALKREVKTPVSYHAGGKFGGLSRVICPVLGGQIAFCVDRFSESSTLEQLELASAKTMIEELKKLI
jgi:hypothetical protein